MGMKCLFCKQQLKLFEQYCPKCGKKVFSDDPPEKGSARIPPISREELLAVLQKNGIMLDQEPVEEENNPAMALVYLDLMDN